jgi:hypothetical protein
LSGLRRTRMLAGMPPIEFEAARTTTADALKASFA